MAGIYIFTNFSHYYMYLNTEKPVESLGEKRISEASTGEIY